MKLSQGSNDVACATQMMLCLAAQMKKSKSQDLDFFICAVRHNIICVAHATSFERKLNFIAARAAQMNDVEALPQMKWACAQ